MSIRNNKGYSFKVVLLGKGCVGKTSLVLRYCENKFNENHLSTLQASFLTKKITVNDTVVNLSIWDTAGQERFHALGPIYYRDSNGAVIVYDVTDHESVIKAKNWIKELRNMLGNTVCLALVANKTDLLDKRTSPSINPVIQEAMAYSATLDKSKHYLTSAKLNEGLQEMFCDLTKRMLDYQKRNRRPDSLQPSLGGSRTLRIQEDDEYEEQDENSRKCSC